MLVLVDAVYVFFYLGLNFVDMEFVFGDNIVYCMSLLKVGFLGEWIGIVIGDERIIEVL